MITDNEMRYIQLRDLLVQALPAVEHASKGLVIPELRHEYVLLAEQIRQLLAVSVIVTATATVKDGES